MSNKTPLILSAIAAIALLVYLYFNKAKKFVALLDYEIASFRVHSVTLRNVLCKVGICVKNPSDLAVSLKDYKVEVYIINADKSRSLLASSPVNQLAIPAKQQITITSDINISTFQLGKLLTNLAPKLLITKPNNMVALVNSELTAKAIVILKADVLGTFIEKEFSLNAN